VGVTSDSTVDDVDRSDDVDGGVSVDLPPRFKTVVAAGLRSANCARLPLLLLLLAEYPGNLLALVRVTWLDSYN